MVYSSRVIACLALLIALTACEQRASELAQADKDAIAAQIEKYRQSALAADWEAWGSTLATDVLLSPPNIAPVRGREAAVAWAKTFPTLKGFTANVDEIVGRGDLAFVRGTYSLDLILPNGSAATDRGAFFDVHRRQPDGTWPYTHVMFHSTEPVAASLPAGSK